MNTDTIRIAQSCAKEARQAATEFYQAVIQDHTELVLFFCSSHYELEPLGEALHQLFAGIQVVGCTTAGEIGPEGYRTHSLTGVSFACGSCVATSDLLHCLDQFDIDQANDFAQPLLQELERRAPGTKPGNIFALMLIDGLSTREEQVTHALHHAIGWMPLFGGSAGDDQQFACTRIYHNGRFHPDSVALILINTPLPFTIFKAQHFKATAERIVVTAANTARRVVLEINGRPAAEEYARLLNVAVDHLTPSHFASSPLAVLINGSEYVRSIQQANPDGSLTFYCAIEEGLVLRVAQNLDLVDNLAQTLDAIHTEVGRPQLILACDCILRNLEITQKELRDSVSKLFVDNKAVGFSCYGEQFQGVHVNQTLTGVAIGSGKPSTRGSDAANQ